jgi:hypothetical protein
MQPTSNPSEIRKLTVDLAKFLEKWAGRHATVHLTGSTVTMAGTILPGRSEQIIMNGRWHYSGSIIVRDSDQDVEVDFLTVAGAV